MTPTHHWITPEEFAELVGGEPHGKEWRSRCPAHESDNPTSLSIGLGHDRQGNPKTLLYCHAQHCTANDICTAVGVPLLQLFALQPDHAQTTRNAPRAKSSRIERLKTMPTPSQDDMAEIMLCEMIVNDADFLRECQDARETFWRLSHEHARKPRLLQALREAGKDVDQTMHGLREEFAVPF